MGRPADGLALLKSTEAREIPDEIRGQIEAALAVAAHDERSLMEALAVQERYARMRAAPVGRPQLEALDAPVAHGSIPVAKRLIEVAVGFGSRYDREALELVGDEAVRRGATDSDSLIQYAALVGSNGDLRKALGIFELAARNATDGSERQAADLRAYDIKNIIYQFTRGQTIEQEEQRRHKKNERFYRQAWN
jgi:hypothetical protein